jgi:hypothetical protein
VTANFLGVDDINEDYGSFKKQKTLILIGNRSLFPDRSSHPDPDPLRQKKIPKRNKKEIIPRLKSLNVLFMVYGSSVLIKKKFSIVNFTKIFGLNKIFVRIRIPIRCGFSKQQPGSRSGKMAGSGFSEHGPETLLTSTFC